jgi:hypothetical protein
LYACDVEYEYDEVALDCALVALRDRIAGTFTAGGENDQCGFEGCGSDDFLIAIATFDEALLHSCSSSPSGPESWSTELTVLAPAPFFQACLDLAAPAARYDCLFDGLQQRTPVCGD